MANCRLASGLDTLGVLHALRNNTCMREIFRHVEAGNLRADGVEALFHDVKFSVKGSNRRTHEERMIGYWNDLLLDLEYDDEPITLKDVLVFATGCDIVPPLGFDPLPSIEFLHAKEERYPTAITCGMVLRLPVTSTYREFKDNMTFGIANSPGFGSA